MAPFALLDSPASSALTQQQFGWKPEHPGSSPTSTKATTSPRNPEGRGHRVRLRGPADLG